MSTATRNADERLLLALALRDDGLTWAQIARVLGSTPETWRGAAHRVERDFAASVAA